jgi:RNA methyltransferase, TrmH family
MRPNPRPVVRPVSGLTSSLIASLRDPYVRYRNGLFVSDGLRFLLRALEAGDPIAGVALGPGKPVPGDVLARLRSVGCPILHLDRDEFSHLSIGDDHCVITVHHQTWSRLPDKVNRKDLWIGVETVKNPGNLGTLLRSAAAVGANGLMVFGPPRDRADPFDPVCVRAAMGAHFGLRVVGTNHAEFRRWACRYEMTVVAATGSATLDYRRISYRRPVLLMLGHERSGLSEAQRASSDVEVRIPMAPSVDSLNIAMAGTVLLYEAYGQQRPCRGRNQH